jgi:hypothetical protein
VVVAIDGTGIIEATVNGAGVGVDEKLGWVEAEANLGR